MFTQSASPTTGLTAYHMERPAKNLDPSSAGVAVRGSYDKWLRRRKRKQAAHAAGATHMGKVHDMTTDENQGITFEQGVEALKKSIASAFKAPEDEREAHANRAIDEFCGWTGAIASEAISESFFDGIRRDFAKFNGYDIDDPMQKGLTDVSAMAGLLNQGEYMLKNWVGDDGAYAPRPWGAKPPAEPLVKAFADWLDAGKMILRSTVDDCLPDAGVAKADLDAELGAPIPVEQLAKAAGALKDAMVKLSDPRVMAKISAHLAGERLAKAEGAPPPAGGGAEGGEAQDGIAEDEVANMDPVEAMGRLAAGIVMIADQLIGGGGEAEDPAAAAGAEGQQPPAGGEGGAPPPAAAKEGENPAAPPPASGGGGEGGESGDEEGKKKPPFAKSEESTMSTETDRLAKLEAGMNAILAKNAALEAEIKVLKEQPMPAKSAAVRLVQKTEDGTLAKGVTDDDLAKEAARIDAIKNPEERARELIKIQHQNPMARLG